MHCFHGRKLNYAPLLLLITNKPVSSGKNIYRRVGNKTVSTGFGFRGGGKGVSLQPDPHMCTWTLLLQVGVRSLHRHRVQQ